MQLRKQPAKTVQGFIVILKAIDEETEAEIKKAKREARRSS
jgi:hypothetical protein